MFLSTVRWVTCRGILLPRVAFPATRQRWMSSYNGSGPGEGKVPGKCLTLSDIHQKYLDGTKLTMLTVHDLVTAQASQDASIDIALVGDSLGMVALGYQNTTTIGMKEMLHHCRIVARGNKRSLLVGDMPFGSYQVSIEQAVTNAIRMIQEGHMHSVKLEGGHLAPTVKRIVDAGVPVIAHIGLTPQSANALGGFKVQGRTAEGAIQLMKDALALQEAGAFAVVIEAVPSEVASFVTQNLSIPVIGIGAGPYTSGQVLVSLDMLGVFDRFCPKFCRKYADLGKDIQGTLDNYVSQVRGSVRQDFSLKEDKL